MFSFAGVDSAGLAALRGTRLHQLVLYSVITVMWQPSPVLLLHFAGIRCLRLHYGRMRPLLWAAPPPASKQQQQQRLQHDGWLHGGSDTMTCSTAVIATVGAIAP
jgi:hypothetical protein